MVDHASLVDAAVQLLELEEGVRSSPSEQLLTVQEPTFDAWHRDLYRLQELVTYNQLLMVPRSLMDAHRGRSSCRSQRPSTR